MAKKLYVGNLPWNIDTQQLEEMFAPHGTVLSATVITDRDTGRSRGFGFIEMESSEAADAAMQAMHEQDVGGRQLTVNEARERSPRPPR